MQTLKRGKFAADAAQLDIIISAQGVGGLVVGLPLNMDGSDGPSAQSARAFGRNWVEPLAPCRSCSRMSGFPPAPSPAPCWMPMPRAAGATRWWTRWPPPTFLQGALDRLRNLTMTDSAPARFRWLPQTFARRCRNGLAAGTHHPAGGRGGLVRRLRP